MDQLVVSPWLTIHRRDTATRNSRSRKKFPLVTSSLSPPLAVVGKQLTTPVPDWAETLHGARLKRGGY